MVNDRMELKNLRDNLENLIWLISSLEKGELPYFYYCFDTMKNNIEIFFHLGCDDIEDFYPVLERDWIASHTFLIGVQYYKPRCDLPEKDLELKLYFSGLLAEIGKYFEQQINIS